MGEHDEQDTTNAPGLAETPYVAGQTTEGDPFAQPAPVETGAGQAPIPAGQAENDDVNDAPADELNDDSAASER